RQVSRAVVVTGEQALTGGADGYLQRFDFKARKLEKTKWRLPAARGRESWASLDAAVERHSGWVFGGTSGGHLFRLGGGDSLDRFGKPFAAGTVQGLVFRESEFICGVVGPASGMPRSFRVAPGADPQTVSTEPGGIPHVEGQPSMVGFG